MSNLRCSRRRLATCIDGRAPDAAAGGLVVAADEETHADLLSLIAVKGVTAT
ncbi:hypothetical protein [Actinoplanes sp. NPDC026623]|uniref:hypothetical protein n=1 Tax=Actinoplanes sp. NPDC026623 TaxID=3155610 RepID=UPI0033C2643D